MTGNANQRGYRMRLVDGHRVRVRMHHGHEGYFAPGQAQGDTGDD